MCDCQIHLAERVCTHLDFRTRKRAVRVAESGSGRSDTEEWNDKLLTSCPRKCEWAILDRANAREVMFRALGNTWVGLQATFWE